MGLLFASAALLMLPLVVWATRALVETIRLLGLLIVGLFRRGGKDSAAESRPQVRLSSPKWPKSLLALGLSFAALGVLATLAALANCGFDISTLPSVPILQLGPLMVDLNGLLRFGDPLHMNL